MSDRTASPTVKNFIRAFGGRWFTKMSGPLTVPFAIAALFWPNGPLKFLFAILAVACAAASSYGIWAHERTHVVSLLDKIEGLRSQLSDLGQRLTETRGPELWLGFDPRTSFSSASSWVRNFDPGASYIKAPLCVQNNGGGTAFNVVVKIPADGSAFISDSIKRVADDKARVICSPKKHIDFGGLQKILAHVLLTAPDPKGIMTIPVLVTCMDGEGRAFEYDFQVDLPLSVGSPFTYKERRCLGRPSSER